MAVTPLRSPVEPDTLTLAELAARLNIGMTKAYEMARADTLPVSTLKVGREFRFSRRSWKRWLDSEAAARSDSAA